MSKREVVQDAVACCVVGGTLGCLLAALAIVMPGLFIAVLVVAAFTMGSVAWEWAKGEDKKE